MLVKFFMLFAAFIGIASSVAAAPVTFAPASDTYVYSFDAGPPVVDGVTTRSIGSNSFVFSVLSLSSSSGGIDYIDPINLGSSRGFWSERGFAFVGGFSSIRFEFLEMISSVGGVMNYSAFGPIAIMRILDQNRLVLEEVDVKSAYPIIIPSFNRGEYRGFQRESSDIKYFELMVEGGGMVIDELTISSSPAVVPLPASAWLLIGGLMSLLAVGRRRKNQTT